MKTALVCGAGGFIGHHLVERLKQESYHVVGVDLKYPDFSMSQANSFLIRDLRSASDVDFVFSNYWSQIDEVYQMAADLGGAGYIFSGEHDADIIHNSSLININVAKRAVQKKVGKLFFPSSCCVYPKLSEADFNKLNYIEDSAYPAQPDSEYGWEKLFSERLYLAYKRNYGLDVRIARFFSVFGTECAWKGGKEQAPAAMCRQVAEAENGGVINIWGDGEQTRSYLYIDECLDGIRLLMGSKQAFAPLSIGTEEVVSINQLAKMIIEISGKKLTLNHIKGPSGIQKTNFDNKLLYEKLNWKPNGSLQKGLEHTYTWIYDQVQRK